MIFLFLLLALSPVYAIFTGVPVRSSNEYPYLVSIRTADGHRCGGILASPNRVVTAVVSCVDGLKAEDISIRSVAPTSTSASPKADVDVKSVQIHPEYHRDNGGIYNNIAVLYLSTNLLLPTPKLAAQGSSPPIGSGVMLVGYGASHPDQGPGPQHLMKVIEPVRPIELCQQQWGGQIQVDGTQNFCSGRPGIGSCMGDQGGPVVDLQGTVVGIIGYMPCGNGGYSDVNVRIGEYATWIQSHGVNGYTFV